MFARSVSPSEGRHAYPVHTNNCRSTLGSTVTYKGVFMGDEPNSSNGSMAAAEAIVDAKLARCHLAQAELQNGFVTPSSTLRRPRLLST